MIALIDSAHVQHDQAHDWFSRTGRKAFATCPLTENGLVRIVGHPRYQNSPGPPSAVLSSLLELRRLAGHRFWPDDLSIADDGSFVPELLSSHSRVTDICLLALAHAKGGRLAALNQRIRSLRRTSSMVERRPSRSLEVAFRPRRCSEPQATGSGLWDDRSRAATAILSHHLAVEEQQRRQLLSVGGSGQPSLAGKPPQEALDFGRTHRSGVTYAMEAPERPHLVDVRFFAQMAVVQKADALPQLIQYFHIPKCWLRVGAAFHRFSYWMQSQQCRHDASVKTGRSLARTAHVEAKSDVRARRSYIPKTKLGFFVRIEMTGYDFNKPFVDSGSLPIFRAIDAEVASLYGTTVRAIRMSNADYARRHSRLAQSNNMKPPPSHGRIFDGYLVVRKMDTSSQYETWIPDHAFDAIYAPI